jgi:hypothetical protein
VNCPACKTPSTCSLNGCDFRGAALTAVGQQPDDRIPDSGAAPHPNAYCWDCAAVVKSKCAPDCLHSDACAEEGACANGCESRGDALKSIGNDLRVMLASSTELVDGIGDVVGYQIKTGALHRILGTLSAAGFPVTVPAVAHRTVQLPEGQR